MDIGPAGARGSGRPRTLGLRRSVGASHLGEATWGAGQGGRGRLKK
jgi:hypothetical protein